MSIMTHAYIHTYDEMNGNSPHEAHHLHSFLFHVLVILVSSIIASWPVDNASSSVGSCICNTHVTTSSISSLVILSPPSTFQDTIISVLVENISGWTWTPNFVQGRHIHIYT